MKTAYLSIATILVAGTILGYSHDRGKSIKSNESRIAENQMIKTNNDSIKDSDALVNYSYFKELVEEVEIHRSNRLINLDEFHQKSKNTNTIILDTRSKSMYDLKHVKGAIHLNFSDFTAQELESLFSQYNGQETEILIYCNNNFYDSKATLKVVEPEFLFQDMAFVSKSADIVKISQFDVDEIIFNNQRTLALNIPTYINLYGYGYKNVYELNELVDVNDPRIIFEGSFDDDTIKN